jgi:hypothetical protein
MKELEETYKTQKDEINSLFRGWQFIKYLIQ